MSPPLRAAHSFKTYQARPVPGYPPL